VHELLHQLPIESHCRSVEARQRDIDKAELAALVLVPVVLDLPRTQVAGSVKVHCDRLRRHDAWMSWPSLARQPLCATVTGDGDFIARGELTEFIRPVGAGWITQKYGSDLRFLMEEAHFAEGSIAASGVLY